MLDIKKVNLVNTDKQEGSNLFHCSKNIFLLFRNRRIKRCRQNLLDDYFIDLGNPMYLGVLSI